MTRAAVLVSTLGCLGAWGCASASSPTQGSDVVVAPAAPASAVAPEPAPEPASADPRAPVPLARLVGDELAATTAGSYEEDAKLYRQGYERELAGDLAASRKAFYELIQRHPSSPLVPYAYLAFAEMFAAEAEADDPSKWPLARQAFTEVVKYPPPANRAYAYAWHRLGVTFARAGEPAKALDAQKKALAAVRAAGVSPAAEPIAESATKELVVAYAAAGRPDAALAFFRTIDAQRVPRLVIALGEEYVRKGAVRETVSLYQSALASAPSDEVCRGAAAATKALQDAALPDVAILAQLDPPRRAACHE